MIGRNLKGSCETVDEVLEKIPYKEPYLPEFSLKVDNTNRFSAPIGNNKLNLIMYLKIDRKTWLNAIKSTYFKKTQSHTDMTCIA